MTLAAGTRLGPYEILAPLGAGGMGEVYRARDTRLSREVAIKVLPERLAADADAAARFEREARAVAALSHPNILAIHDIGREGGTAYAVTELLEGATLRERLQGGALPLRKCVEYGAQIAEGLAAAHEKGIVHRDLKPENVFVSPDGRVKILDFGLARSVAPPLESDTQSPTAAQPTDPGTVLGTAGYMSPEQVRGKPADHRSDIFSLGALLYEMATGRRAFQGDSAIETMNAVLKEEPPEVSTVRGLPPEFDRVVRHCLEKSPGERFQSARDIVFALKSVAAESSVRTGALAPRLALRRYLPAAALLAAAAAAGAAYLAGRGAGERIARANPPTYQTLTFRRGTVLNARFASDGSTVVYSAAWQGEPAALFTVRATSPESQKLDVPPAVLYSVSKSDELAIGLGFHYTTGFTNEATLARVPLSGGAPRPVAERVASADWSPDGSTLAIARFSGKVCQLEYPPGQVLFTTTGWLSDVRVSPDGKRVAFFDHPDLADGAGELMVADREGKSSPLAKHFDNVGGLAWAQRGRQIWWSGAEHGSAQAIYASDLSGGWRVVSRTGAGDLIYDVAPSGAAVVGRWDAKRQVEVASGGAAARDLSWLDWSYPTDISADGRQLLFTEQGEGSASGNTVYIRGTDGAPAVQLGDGLLSRAISPDGKTVSAVRRSGGAVKILLLPTGVGQQKEISLPGIEANGIKWFPDGRRLLVSSNSASGPATFFDVVIAAGTSRAIASPKVISFCYALSRDGTTIAAVRTNGSLALIPVSGGAARELPLAAAGQPCVLSWSADGRGIYYTDGTPMPARLHRLEIAAGRDEVVREVSPQDRSGVQSVEPVLITPDGKTVAYSYRRILGKLMLVKGLR